MKIELTPVERSSNLAKYGYDAASQTLRVEFKSGKQYDYAEVTAEQFAALGEAESKGAYLNTFIKPAHECTPVEATQ